MLTRVVVAFLVYFVCWRLFVAGDLPFLGAPLYFFTPAGWWTDGLTRAPVDHRGMAALELYELLGTVGMFLGFARIGGWRAAFDRLVASRGPWYRALGAAAAALVVVLLIENKTLSVYPLAFAHLPYAELGSTAASVITYALYALIYLPVILVFGRLGGWASLLADLLSPAAPPAAAPGDPGDPGGPEDPVGWPQLRAAGLGSPPTGWPPKPKRAA